MEMNRRRHFPHEIRWRYSAGVALGHGRLMAECPRDRFLYIKEARRCADFDSRFSDASKRRRHCLNDVRNSSALRALKMYDGAAVDA